jgi:hypothetical protein
MYGVRIIIKCSQCNNLAQKVEIGTNEVRWLCKNHRDKYQSAGHEHKAIFVRASDL